MSVDGRWTIVMKTPLGAQPATLTLRATGARLDGAIDSALGSGEISEGLMDGEALSWAAELRLPRPGRADFSARIDGDSISGVARVTTIGAMPFKGSRAV